MVMNVVVEQLIQLVLMIYNFISHVLSSILAETVFKFRPELAEEYGNAFMLMISITSIYLVLKLVKGIEKVVQALLIVGWLWLLIVLILSIIFGA